MNLQIAVKPIAVTLPNGRMIQSTHTCNLEIPWLPHAMSEAHIVPGLAHSSLISTRKFCAAGCQVTFDEEECRVYHKGHLVLVGDRDEETNLWRLPVNPTAKPTHDRLAHLDLHMTPKQATNHVAQNVYTIPYKQNQLKFMHQTFFCPPHHNTNSSDPPRALGRYLLNTLQKGNCYSDVLNIYELYWSSLWYKY